MAHANETANTAHTAGDARTEDAGPVASGARMNPSGRTDAIDRPTPAPASFDGLADPGVLTDPGVPEPGGDNEAVELVGNRVQTVEVSKHPDATIPETELSLADIERGRSHPAQWAVYVVAVLVAIIGPYWLGRALAVHDTAWLTDKLNLFTPQGMTFISWTVTLVAVACLGLAVVDSKRWLWRILFAVGLAAEQLVAGVSLLKFDFWYSTYVVYGDSAAVANAANLGIIAAGVGVAVFAVIWVGLLVIVDKDSPLNVLTRSWASFILFFVIEVVALLVVMFGGLLTTV